MPASSGKRSPWLRRGLPATLGGALVLVLLYSLGVFPSPRSHQGESADATAVAPLVTPHLAPTPTTRPPSGLGVAVPAAEPFTAPDVAPYRQPEPTNDGSPSWVFPESVGPLLGHSGQLLRFRVAVEEGLPSTASEFTAVVDATLGDSRSWTAGGDVRLQRMPSQATYDFTIYLATPATAYDLCLRSGVDIREGGVPYTSCRAGDSVVINSDRYFDGVPNYAAPLADYRQYVINHEVGHRLGQGHVLCPGPGRLAPVMQQQTLGLQGCVANSWPYVERQRYTGPPTT